MIDSHAQAMHVLCMATKTISLRLDAYERKLLVEALQAADGNRTDAARSLGIGRATLHDKLRTHGL